MGDRRLGETWTPHQRAKNAVLFGAAAAALWTAKSMPDGIRRRAGRACGTLAASALPSHRRRADARLQAAFGPRPPLDAWGVFETLGQDLADTIALFRGALPARDQMPLSQQSVDCLRSALDMGRGVVFATAHLGPIDVMAASVAECGFPVATLARESYDPRFTELYDAMRDPRGIRTIYRGRPGTETSIVRCLRDGLAVGFPMDLAGRGMAVRRLPFLGSRPPIPVGPAAIARRLRIPVVVGTPAPGRSQLHVRIEMIDAGGQMPERELTAALAGALEARIRDLPHHWPWMHEGRC